MQIGIKRALERIPGGTMVATFAISAGFATFARHTAFFGSFTGALFHGALPILAVFYVWMGLTIELAALPTVARRGGVLPLTKIGLGIATGVLVGHLLGERPVTSGWFAGLSGRPEEAGACAVMTLDSGPFLTMATLGVAGLSAFPWQTLVGAVLPLAAGIVIGNLDREMRDFLGAAAPALIPFFAFALGTSVAGNAAAVPATALVASCVIVTSLPVPVLTVRWARHVGRPTSNGGHA